ncbi:MAG: hypothetical protein U0637_02450 [Phycisphaerales bacterium]
MMSNTFSARLRTAVAPAALLSACGLAHATAFTFTPQCSNNWYGECQTTPCVSSGWNTYNNWNNNHACVGGFATPGPADSVTLPAGQIRQNGGIAVSSMTTNPATVYEWDSGDMNIATPFTLTGTLNLNAGSKSITGPITNAATWNFADTSGWTLYFTNCTFTNNATVNQNQVHVDDNGGANLFVNNGTWTKNHNSQSNWTELALVNNNLFRTQLGTMAFYNAPITTTNPAARWNTDAGAATTFNNCSFVGTLTGNSQGTTGFNTLNLAGNFSNAVSGNGLRHMNGDINLAGFTLTNAPAGRLFIDAGSKSLVGGSVVNNGEWNFSDTSGWTMYFQNASFTNNATVNQTQMHVDDNGGTNLFTNNGTWTKNFNSQSNWMELPLVNNSLFRTQLGTMAFYNTPITTTNPAARWNTDAGAATTFNNCSLSGTLTGDSQGSTTLNTMNLAADLSWNITGNGMHFASGNINLNGHTLTNTATGRASVDPGSKSLIGGAVVNNGEWNLSDPSGWTLYFQSASLTNNGTLNINTMHLTDNGGTNAIINNGTFAKVTNSTAIMQVIPFTNNGVVRADTGTQQFNSAQIQSVPAARWNTAPNAALVLNSDAITGTFKGTSDGTTQVNTMSVPANATIDFANNGLVWQSGNLSTAPAATLTNAPTGALHIADAGSKTLSGTLVNNGLCDDYGQAGWTVYFDSASFVNNGTLVKRAMHWTNNNGANSFLNTGTFRKENADTVYFTALPLTNSGLLQVQQGSLQLMNVPFTQTATGNLNVNATLASNTDLTVAAGRITGTGTLSVPANASQGLVNSGATAAPGNSTGVLTVSGNYRQQAAAALEVELYGTTLGTGYDRLAVTGNATLGGTLRLMWPTGNIPSIGDSFTILTTAANGRSGTFSNIDNTEPGYVVDIAYGPSSVTVTVIDIICDDIDFNGDGLFPDTADIDDFLAVFSGAPCPTGTCGDIDFNNDGLFPDTTDIDTLLQVFSGGGCL